MFIPSTIGFTLMDIKYVSDICSIFAAPYILLRAASPILGVGPCHSISHIQDLAIYFFPTPPRKVNGDDIAHVLEDFLDMDYGCEQEEVEQQEQEEKEDCVITHIDQSQIYLQV